MTSGAGPAPERFLFTNREQRAFGREGLASGVISNERGQTMSDGLKRMIVAGKSYKLVPVPRRNVPPAVYTVSFRVRLTDAQHDKVLADAARTGASKSDVARELMERAL